MREWPSPVRVDETDLRIAHQVIAGPARTLHGRRERVDAVAKRLGIHRNTVRRRIARLHQLRCIFPLRGLINPAPLGGMFSRAYFEIPIAQQSPELEQELFDEVEGLWCILRLTHGWDLMVAAANGTDAEHAFATASRVLGVPRFMTLIRTDRDWEPRTPIKLAPLDLGILEAVVKQGLVPFGRIAREQHVSKRTVERHYAFLSEHEVIRLWPTGGAPLAGVTMSYLHVDLDPDLSKSRQARQELLREPNQFLLDVRSRKAWAYLFSDSATTLQRIAARIGVLPGVKTLFTQTCHGMSTSPHFVELNHAVLKQRT